MCRHSRRQEALDWGTSTSQLCMRLLRLLKVHCDKMQPAAEIMDKCRLRFLWITKRKGLWSNIIKDETDAKAKVECCSININHVMLKTDCECFVIVRKNS